jgi:hypothetical protein
MKCVECGAQTGPSRYCRRCGAPVVDRPLDEALARKTLGTASAKRSTAWATGICFALLNLFALVLAIGFPVAYVTRGTPAQERRDSSRSTEHWAATRRGSMLRDVPAVPKADWDEYAGVCG